MGKITVRRTGDWQPCKRTKEYREHYDAIFRKKLQEIDPGYVERLTKLSVNPREKADDGEGDIIGEHDTRTMTRASEGCICGCQSNRILEHFATKDA